MVEQVEHQSVQQEQEHRRREITLQRTTEAQAPVGRCWQDSHPILLYIPLRTGDIRLFNNDLIVRVDGVDPVAQTAQLVFEEIGDHDNTSLNLDSISIKDNVINVCGVGEFACRKIKPDGRIRLVASLDESIRLHG